MMTPNEIWWQLTDAEKFQFIENNVNIVNSKGVLMPLKLASFQKEWLLNGPLFQDFSKKTQFNNRIALKCRNIGASYVMIGVEATLTAYIYPNIFIPFVASKEEQASDLIKHCKKVIDHCAFTIPLNGKLENQSTSEIRFSNGSRLKSFPGGNPGGIRGPRALCSYIDEFAFVQKQQEVLSAVEFFHAEGGQLNLLSTPYGKQNMYWQIWSKKKDFPSWLRFYTPLFTDMNRFDINRPIPDQISEGLILNVPWLNIDFIEKKRNEDRGFNYCNFLQEMCGVPIEEVTAVIPEGLLDTNKVNHYFVEHRPILSDGSPDPEPIYVISADFGASRNMTALVCAEAKEGRLVVCNTALLKGNFTEQITAIKSYVEMFGPKIFIGDSTGLGGVSFMDQLQEVLSVGMVIGVSYAKKNFADIAGVDMNNKAFMVNKAVTLLSQGSLIVPNNFRDLREEILGLQKLVYENSIKYSGKNGPVGRDDLAMAWLHLSLVYDRIYSLGDQDYVTGAANDPTGWYKKKDRLQKPKGKAEYIEVASVSSFKADHVRKEMDKYKGFERLI